jgi:hypothetical protein
MNEFHIGLYWFQKERLSRKEINRSQKKLKDFRAGIFKESTGARYQEE